MKKCLVGLLLGMVMLAGCGSNGESSQPAQNNVQVNDNRTTTEDTAGNALIGSGSEVAMIMGLTKVAALAYLMFNLYTPPCFAALGAMNSEMKSGKWLAGAICFQLATGYTIGFLVYQIGTLITTGSVGAGFVGGLMAVFVFAAVVIYLCVNANRKVKLEYALDAKG